MTVAQAARVAAARAAAVAAEATAAEKAGVSAGGGGRVQVSGGWDGVEEDAGVDGQYEREAEKDKEKKSRKKKKKKESAKGGDGGSSKCVESGDGSLGLAATNVARVYAQAHQAPAHTALHPDVQPLSAASTAPPASAGTGAGGEGAGGGSCGGGTVSAFVDTLPLFLVDLEEDDSTCNICLDNIADGCLKPCGHSFCGECIVQLKKRHVYLVEGVICPLCRAPVKEFQMPELPSAR